MLVATLRSKGVAFSDGGAEIPDHLDGVERMSVVRGQRELTEMLTGAEAWPAVAALDTGWLADLWGRLDDDGATVLYDDFTERFEWIFVVV